MASSAVAAQAWTLRGLREGHAGWGLLRADLAPVVAAVLGEHLGGSPRVLASVELLDRLEADLHELRDAGFELPRTPQEYVGEWTRQGILVRRVGEGRQETLELSPAAMSAVSYVAGLERPHAAVTSSRLTNVIDLLSRLARDTDPSPESRLASLLAERDALDAQIEAVRTGRYVPVDAASARERLVEVLRLAGEIPTDFARVGAELEQLNRTLREQVLAQSGPRGSVLEAVFAGVDLIEESEAGRTFSAFHDVVVDPVRTEALESAVDDVLERGFAVEAVASRALSRAEAALLRRLLEVLQAESLQVRQVMTSFSRSLRRFVETTTPEDHRCLVDALREAQQAALQAARTTRPYAETGYELALTSVPIASVGSWSLHNPADLRTAEPVTVRDNEPLDLEALRAQVRASEIDFAELEAAVWATVSLLGPSSIGDVLAAHPATQGLASVVGLLVLAHQAGIRTDITEELSWWSQAGREKTVRAPRYLFMDVPEPWRHQ